MIFLRTRQSKIYTYIYIYFKATRSFIYFFDRYSTLCTHYIPVCYPLRGSLSQVALRRSHNIRTPRSDIPYVISLRIPSYRDCIGTDRPKLLPGWKAVRSLPCTTSGDLQSSCLDYSCRFRDLSSTSCFVCNV